MVYQVKHLFMGMVSRFYSYDSQDMAIGQGNDSCAAVCVCRNVVAGLHRGPKKGSSIGTGWYKFLSWNMMKYGSSICSSCFFQNPQFFSCFSMKKHGDFDLESSGNHQKKKTRLSPSPCARGLGLIIRRPSLSWIHREGASDHWSIEAKNSAF